MGNRNPGVPDEEGGRVGQGVVGEHRDHASLRIFKRDAPVLGVGLDVCDVLGRILALGGGNGSIEGLKALALGAGQELLRCVVEGLLVQE